MRKLFFDIEIFSYGRRGTKIPRHLRNNTSKFTTMAGKKRKASGQSAKSRTQDFDKSKGKVAFTTYEDIADSEDEFHINRDKVMLDDEPNAKRQRKSNYDG